MRTRCIVRTLPVLFAAIILASCRPDMDGPTSASAVRPSLSVMIGSKLVLATGTLVRSNGTFPNAIVTYDQAMDDSDVGSNPGIELWTDSTLSTRVMRSNDNNGQWDYVIAGAYFTNGNAVVYGTRYGSHAPQQRTWTSAPTGSFLVQTSGWPAPRLVASYPLDGNGSDTSSYGNTGTLVGDPMPTLGRRGQPNSALEFGNGAYVSVPSSDVIKNLTTEMSLIFWIRRGPSMITDGIIPVFSLDATELVQSLASWNHITGTWVSGDANQFFEVGFKYPGREGEGRNTTLAASGRYVGTLHAVPAYFGDGRDVFYTIQLRRDSTMTITADGKTIVSRRFTPPASRRYHVMIMGHSVGSDVRLRALRVWAHAAPTARPVPTPRLASAAP